MKDIVQEAMRAPYSTYFLSARGEWMSFGLSMLPKLGNAHGFVRIHSAMAAH